MNRRTLAIFLLLFSTLSTLRAFAQFDSASVIGNLRDASGAAVVRGTVTLTNVATGISQTAATGNEGEYEFTSVKPGDYTLRGEQTGFAQSNTAPFNAAVGTVQRVNLALRLGSASEVVTVTDAATLLQTDSSDRGTVIGNQEIVNLPLNGRSYADLVLLVPGVRRSILENQTTSNRDASFNVNGQRSEFNNFILDGLDNNAYGTSNQGFSNQAIQITPDAIGEFRVVTDNYSAEYGRVVGAVINATSKSGTNALHGDVYEYIRNTSLNAIGPFLPPRNPLLSTATSPVYQKPALQRNQFGATLGGPIFRDRQFFFVDYEGLRQNQSQISTAVLPTAAQKADPTAGGTIKLFNPLTGAPFNPNSDPTAFAKSVIALLPNPQIGNNFTSLPKATIRDDKGDGRYDITLNQKLNGFARYSQRNVSILDVGSGQAYIPGNAGPGSGANGNVHIFNRQVVGGIVYTLSPTQIIDARFGYTYTEGSKAAPNLGQPSLLAAANIPNIPTDPSIVGPLNVQNISGFTQLGRQNASPQHQNPTIYNPKANYTWLLGKHSMKFGYEYQHISTEVDDFHPKYGADTYAAFFSALSPAKTTAPTDTPTRQAAAVADFLTGARSHYELNNIAMASIQQRLHAVYAQDDWHVRDNLTLNIGLRYELGTPQWEANNQLSNFDPTTSPTTGKFLLASSGSIYNRALVNQRYLNFAPRLGFALQANPKTVIRSGYGISYIHFNREGGENLLSYNAPGIVDETLDQVSPFTGTASAQRLCSSLDATPNTCFQSTQAGYLNTFLPTAANRANYNPLLFQARYSPKNDPIGYSQQWQLTLQRQITSNTSFDIAYVGVRGVHLSTLGDENEAFANVDSATCSATVQSGCLTVQARRPFSKWAGIEISYGNGYSNYQALQAKLEHHTHNGLYLLNSFTFSKAMDNSSGHLENGDGDNSRIDIYNPARDSGRSSYDQPINDTLSIVYDLPYGRGRLFGRDAPFLVQEVLGGWQLTAINIVTSGLPVGLAYSPAAALQVTSGGLYTQRPNQNGNAVNPGTSWIKTDVGLAGYLNPLTVTIPTDPAQPFGNASRNSARSLGYHSLDLGIHKAFAVLPDRRLSADFRTEAFNLLNEVNYGVPDGNRSNGTFGSITTNYPPRQLQFALKMIF